MRAASGMRALSGNLDVTGITIETRYWNGASPLPSAASAAATFDALPTNMAGYTNAPLSIPSLARRLVSVYVDSAGWVDTTWAAVRNPAGADANVGTRIRVSVTAKNASSVGVRFGVDCLGCVLLLDGSVIAESFNDLTWYGYYWMDISDTDVPQWVTSDQVLLASPVSLTKGTHVFELLSFENGDDYGAGAQIDVGNGWTDVIAPVPDIALTVTKAGGGAGVVTSSPAGINCGATCTASFPFGSLVTLTATATAPSAFAGWSGACTGAAPTCTVSLDMARTVTATFAGTVTLSSLTEETRHWSRTPYTQTVSGAVAAFEALPTNVDGYTNTPIRVASLMTNSALVGRISNLGIGWRYVFTLDVAGGPAEIGVRFNPDFGGGGAVRIDATDLGMLCGDGCASAPVNLSFDNYVLPVGRHVITVVGFENCCDGQSAGWFNLGDGRGLRDVSQLLQPVPSYTLSTVVTGSGLVVSMPGSINCGTNCTTTMPVDTRITLSASPSAGWIFAGWSGACTGTGPCVVTLTGPSTVGARFSNGQDVTPPTLSCQATPAELWPVNHKMRDIRINVSAIDQESGPVAFKLLSVVSNEPPDGKGDGKTEKDIDDWKINTADVKGELRAERDGNRRDRVYTFTYGATDNAGNTATTTCAVVVPHDQKH